MPRRVEEVWKTSVPSAQGTQVQLVCCRDKTGKYLRFKSAGYRDTITLRVDHGLCNLLVTIAKEGP